MRKLFSVMREREREREREKERERNFLLDNNTQRKM